LRKSGIEPGRPLGRNEMISAKAASGWRGPVKLKDFCCCCCCCWWWWWWWWYWGVELRASHLLRGALPLEPLFQPPEGSCAVSVFWNSDLSSKVETPWTPYRVDNKARCSHPNIIYSNHHRFTLHYGYLLLL
jgi:hypothetical protein